jgi:thioredoxin 2
MNDKVHVVCGHCAAVVGLSAARLGDAPHCPRCRFALFEGAPLVLTAANIDKHLTRDDLPLIVDFWAPWCGPCQAMAPAFAAAARQLEPHVRLGKVNTDDEHEPAERFRIRSIPTLVVFSGGREITRTAGAMPAAALVQWISSAVAPLARFRVDPTSRADAGDARSA